MSGATVTKSHLVVMVAKRFGAGLVAMTALFFPSAGTVAYWEAWLFLAVFLVPAILILTYLFKRDPALLERRMRARENEPDQSFVMKLGSVCYLVALLLPGLDERFGWSHVPPAVVVGADVLFLLSYGLFFLVLRENSYASRVVEVEEGQKVISTGPYAVVRHPMYVGTLGMLFATPVALGSWWAVIPALPMIPLLVLRIRGEERVLRNSLAGYEEYMRTTRHRLIPGVW